MKTRCGFVSNSSSTSFLLAVNVKEDQDAIGIAWALNLKNYVSLSDDKHPLNLTIDPLELWKGQLGYELEELNKDATWLKERIHAYDEVLKLDDENLFTVCVDLIALETSEVLRRRSKLVVKRDITEEDRDSEVRYRRWSTEHCTSLERLDDLKNQLKGSLARNANQIEKLQKRIDDVTNATSDKGEWKVVGFEINNMASEICEAVDILIKKTNVIVIQKEVS